MSDEHKHPETPASAAPGHEEEPKYETQEVLRPRVMVGFFLTLIIIVVAALVVSAFLEKYFMAKAGPPRPLVPAVGSQAPPQPQIQPDPAADMRALDLTQKAVLDSYGWANQEKTAARIPIQRAMEILAEKGLPYGKPSPTTSAPQQDKANR